MILVDTSVWIDHLHAIEPVLVEQLDASAVVQHPMVLGELALGSLRQRQVVLEALSNIPSVNVSTHSETIHLVEQRRLWGVGLSLVDAHLLASTILTPGTRLWTRDAKLRNAAAKFGVAFEER